MKIGTSALAIWQQAAFGLPREVIVEQVRNVLVPQVPIDEMTSRGR